MKIFIKVTDDQGTTFEGSTELVRASGSPKASKRTPKTQIASKLATELSFSLNPRAFMKRYAKGMSGRQKFTLLLARLAQGKPGQVISGELIASEWNRMTEVLAGPYNGAHATRAKAEGWVDSPKRNHYALSGSWKEALGDD